MITVCYVIGQITRGGAEKQLYELVKSIDRAKFRPIVISLSQGGHWSEEMRRAGIELIELRRTKNRESARLFRLIRLLSAIKPEIVHTYLISGNFYGRIAAILARVPIIIASERNVPDIGKDKNLPLFCIDKLLSPFTHGIICNSYKASNVLIGRYLYSAKKVFTVHNGIYADAYARHGFHRSKERAPTIVGTVGRLWPQKNHKLFLDMAKAVLALRSGEDIRFIIVGGGPLQGDLEKYAKYLRIEDRVTFTGERSDVWALLRDMDIFVMTSLYEGISNAIMEAMLMGLPVVATDVGGNCELVTNGETGFLCPSHDENSLADKVIGLMKAKENARIMGGEGKKRILDEFSLPKMVKKTEDVYLTLLARNNVMGGCHLSEPLA